MRQMRNRLHKVFTESVVKKHILFKIDKYPLFINDRTDVFFYLQKPQESLEG